MAVPKLRTAITAHFQICFERENGGNIPIQGVSKDMPFDVPGKQSPGETMASVRKIPYGYNPNYETVVKIIGSKYVRFLAEKPDG